MKILYEKIETSDELPVEKGFYLTDCGIREFDKESEICNIEWELVDWWLKGVEQYNDSGMSIDTIKHTLQANINHTRNLGVMTIKQLTDRQIIGNILHNQAIIMEALIKILPK